ncbi:hypothetical protein [Phytohabitans rumicis]|uniref:SMODS and SLOG-associating 2TM effector domain-containing protein n=1 Tax=Phytohabitans rumicis TaxID=1076125 RepID=A0A6V8L8L2_9ACTN|nr:hypothetical protein [Phytohabitans rumicis]GFJ91328.1 hypothetical protein Prum_049700 [Phytohabitans rumicis]
MPLKWTAVVVATVAVTLCVTANILVATLSGHPVPVVVNLFALACASVASVTAVIAEYYQRLDDRLSALTEFLAMRLAELDNHTGDRNSGFVEGYLLSHSQDATVVPLGSRAVGRRAMTGRDD